MPMTDWEKENDQYFAPCNERESNILDDLHGDDLKKYKILRHNGATVTESLEGVQQS